MKNILKQLEGWATHSAQSDFKKAIVTLTAYYTMGVFIVLFIFNIMVYSLFVNSIKTGDDKKIESPTRQDNSEELKEDETKELQDNLVNILLISDAMILIITVIVAYMSSKKTLAPLEESYKKQVRFVADAAHELRTPLAVIKAGFDVTLRQERRPEEYIKFIKESLEEVKRLTNLSNDLLLLVKDKGREVNYNTEVFLDEICNKKADMIKPYADLKNITINKDIERNITIKGNDEDLTRLIINLLKNAVDYNKKDGTVLISLKKENDKVVLIIKDTGIGISREDSKHIYDRFYKVDSSRSDNSSGTGLGLAIVKEIVDGHFGSIYMDSEIGKGTVFKVILPSI